MAAKPKVNPFLNFVHPAAFVSNFVTYTVANKYNPQSIIDVGGTGKCDRMKICGILNKTCATFNANITEGYNGVLLSQIKTKSFDVSLSVAVLEHVGGDENFIKFVNECVRVARLGSVHWFPYGASAFEAEKVKAKCGHPHPCILPSAATIKKVCTDHAGTMKPCVSIGTHLMSVGCLNKHGKVANNKLLYDFMIANELQPYGYLLEIPIRG